MTVNGPTLAITKVASQQSATPHSPVLFTITVTNNGPGPADGSRLTDPVIAGFSASSVNCVGTSGGAVCPAGVTLGNLQGSGIVLSAFPSGGTLSFELAGTLTLTTGSITNTATASLPPGLPGVPQNASATVLVEAIPGTPIPTLSEYALIALMLILAAAGGVYLRRAPR